MTLAANIKKTNPTLIAVRHGERPERKDRLESHSEKRFSKPGLAIIPSINLTTARNPKPKRAIEKAFASAASDSAWISEMAFSSDAMLRLKTSTLAASFFIAASNC